MKLDRIFEKAFSSVEAEIYEIKDEGGYSDEVVQVKIGSCTGDLQPYVQSSMGSLTANEYGLQIDTTNRFFCRDPDKLLKTGRIMVIGDKKYDVLQVSVWESGNVALLRER